MGNELENEIGAMLDIPVEPPPAAEPVPAIPADPAEPAPAAAPPEPATPAELHDPVATPAEPVTPAPAEPVPAAPAAPAGPTVESLLATIADMQKRMSEMAATVVPAAPVTPSAAPAAPATPAAVQKFVEKEEELNAVLDNIDNFNAFISKVISIAREGVVTTDRVGEIVSPMASEQVVRQIAIKEFYDANADLQPHRSYVGYVAQRVAEAHPDWTLADIIGGKPDAGYAGLGAETRKSLGIQDVVAAPPAAPASPGPAFVPGGGTRSGGGVTEIPQLQKDIDNLISD